ncbi:LysR substrate-binding domain-containing protein [Defluviimonas sp. WL0002]|uniref:LysR substrate-binding domain-containing protein n=1 Tax=Albidovulum marisflavi TaxID=2984159 RepID=A0ABT2ZGX6_9RHOB|nr:LysR substrate-binding domain-containing protein [Defluviimonas sp. WL0002]MCV2870277.1 LysR substrate-binding domain-containing protein [Defluviimonas sp. WL0002]
METLRRILPSINSLIVFEAAGRLSSFSAAARELGMTQAAVSYAIHRLEQQLGRTLFLREFRRVRLSEVGQKFHTDVSIGLSHIQRSAQDIRATPTGNQVTLACSTAFASFWMVPRMTKFREDLPGVDLRIQTADRDLELETEGAPLGIRGGSAEEWPQLHAEVLASEEIYPVCGAKYLPQIRQPIQASDLLSCKLIHLEEPFRSATTWRDWFASVGVPGNQVPSGLKINDYVLVVQAVIEGQGIALGWRHLVEGLVEKGVLVRLTGHMVTTAKDFYVVWPKDRPLSHAAASVRDWLLDQRKDAQATVPAAGK